MGAVTCEVSLSVTESGRRAPQYTLDTDLEGELTLADLMEFTKSSLIIIADQTLKEEQANGFDKDPVVAVDGRVGKKVENVSPFGSIEFTSRSNLNEMLTETYDALIYRSPVLTGRYASSHIVTYNGTQVASSASTLAAWLAKDQDFKEGDTIRFVDTQPYARKLERYGITAQRSKGREQKSRDKTKKAGTKVKAPNGTYYLTYRSINRKYKRNVKVGFSFIPGSQIGLSQTFKSAGSNRKSNKFRPARTYLYPTITIQVYESGVTS